ncbi:MAG: hypothetical protein ERJ67_07760 [Aphanocapsa feldmannii 277cV]|uniref:Uncharacterized protein n=1 Tax=Aphanocapsa feldmannii 277cV TaxID=2507553 RepID=A0A524RMF0_9CHRO|nr:MAG: hypothetical protein ERJ67_07760 [Aphanocapsa feldmannii 277cV]
MASRARVQGLLQRLMSFPVRAWHTPTKVIDGTIPLPTGARIAALLLFSSLGAVGIRGAAADSMTSLPLALTRHQAGQTSGSRGLGPAPASCWYRQGRPGLFAGPLH